MPDQQDNNIDTGKASFSSTSPARLTPLRPLGANAGKTDPAGIPRRLDADSGRQRHAYRCGLDRDLCGLHYRLALAVPVDLRAPPQTTGARSFEPNDPYSAIAPQTPLPPVRENDRLHAFLEAAWSAVDRGQSEEAQDALERAETRLLDRAVAMNSAQKPDDRHAVLDIGVARQVLTARDRPGALRAIDDVCAAAGGGVSPLPRRPSRSQARIEQVQTLVARQILTTKFSIPLRILSDGLARQLRITVRERRCDRSSCQ